MSDPPPIKRHEVFLIIALLLFILSTTCKPGVAEIIVTAAGIVYLVLSIPPHSKTDLMTSKLLLALALVGAMHAGEPSTPSKAMTTPAAPGKSYTAPASLAAPIAVDGMVLGSISDDWKSPDCVYTFLAGLRGKIVVHDEPTVTKKPDGSWEITFAGKGAPVTLTVPLNPSEVVVCPVGSSRPVEECDKSRTRRLEGIAVPLTPEVMAQILAPDAAPAPIGGYSKDIEAVSKIMPPAERTVRWMTISALDDENGRRTNAYEFGLRTDGCVVWRERK